MTTIGSDVTTSYQYSSEVLTLHFTIQTTSQLIQYAVLHILHYTMQYTYGLFNQPTRWFPWRCQPLPVPSKYLLCTKYHSILILLYYSTDGNCIYYHCHCTVLVFRNHPRSLPWIPGLEFLAECDLWRTSSRTNQKNVDMLFNFNLAWSGYRWKKERRVKGLRNLSVVNIYGWCRSTSYFHWWK